MSVRLRGSTGRSSVRATALLGLAAVIMAGAATAHAATAAGGGTIRRALAGDDVAIHNLVGSLRVVPAEGSSVIAEITTAGRDASRLRVEDGGLRGRSTLRVVYPADRIHVEEMSRSSSTTLRVREDGTLDVSDREGRKVTLSGRDGGLDARADVVVQVPRGKRVSIYWGHGDGDVSGVDGILSVDGASLGVKTRETKGSLSIEVGSGAVSVEGARGSLSVETGSGDVHLRDVRGDGLAVETGSGGIDASGIDAARLTLETGSGDVRAASIRAPRASLETGSGRVELLLDGDAEELSLESGSGDVSLSVPGGFGAAVHFETGSGDIDSDVPITIRSRNRHEINGTIGDGQGTVSVETGSGGITIRRARG